MKGFLTLLLAAAICSLNLTGCAGPLLFGLKEVETSSGAKYKFITGADFGVSLNGVDTVENVRGIKPTEGK